MEKQDGLRCMESAILAAFQRVLSRAVKLGMTISASKELFPSLI